jgi:competence protein ComFC
MCRECQGKVVFIKGRRCIKCSVSLISEAKICTRCREREYYFTQNYALCEYRDTIKDLIYFYKFKAKRTLCFFFAELLYKYLSLKKTKYLLIPVPSMQHNVRKRGWDHMRLIARVLHNRYRIPVLSCLKRKGWITQKELSSRERFENIVGSISCTHGQQLIGLQEAVLLDDIFTTGATANECARVLIDNGVKEVSVLTVALD